MEKLINSFISFINLNVYLGENESECLENLKIKGTELYENCLNKNMKKIKRIKRILIFLLLFLPIILSVNLVLTIIYCVIGFYNIFLYYVL